MAQHAQGDSNASVPTWADEQLKSWLVNVSEDTLPDSSWDTRQFAAYARKVLKFSEAVAELLLKIDFDGQSLKNLYLCTKDDCDMLVSQGLSLGQWIKLRGISAQMGGYHSKKRQRAEGEINEPAEDYDAEPPRKKTKVDVRRQSYPPQLNLSRDSQTKRVWVALRSIFVGRIKELETLKSKVLKNLNVEYHRPTTIVISGPCGIGKSHLALKLIEEFKFDWSIAISAVAGSNPNQLLWEELGMRGPPMSNYEIFKQIVESLQPKSQAEPFKVAIFFDEVHYFDPKHLETFRQDVTFINSTYSREGLIQLILAGVSTTFLPLDLGDQPSSGGWHVTNLQPFNRDDSKALLLAALASFKDDGVVQKFNQDGSIIEHAISWFGGNPRLIEFAASCLRENPQHDAFTLINSVTTSFSDMYASRLLKKKAVYPLIIAACLSQLPVYYRDELHSKDATVKVSYLVRNGIVGFKPFLPVEDYGEDTLGCLTLSMLEVRRFVSLNKLYFDVPLLTDPKLKWAWQEFEKFVAQMLNIRVRAFASLGMESITIGAMFPGVPMPPKISKSELSVSLNSEVRTLEKQCKDYASVKNSFEAIGQKMPDTTVFLNASKAPSWDVAYAAKEQLQLVVQAKHTEKDDGGNTVQDSVIREELKKMPYGVPSLFITNRIAENLEALRGSHDNLILVTRENLAAFLGMFSLHRFTGDQKIEQAIL